jgi:DNA-binding protein H-NS
MSRTYIQIVKQIETLQAEAEKLRKQEIEGVVQRIRDAIDHYGLNASDLGLQLASADKGKTAAKKRGRKAKAAFPTKVIKFRDEQGRGWGGRGKRPQWLRDALATGKTLNDFLVK